MTAPNETIISQIQKLLALAGNNPNEHERNAAMEKAFELLGKHNLTMAQVKSSKKSRLHTTNIKADKWRRTIVAAISKLYYTKSLIQRMGTKDLIVLVGREDNVRTTELITEWLIDAIRREGNSRFTSNRQRISFRLGGAAMVTMKALQLMEMEKQKASYNEFVQKLWNKEPGTSLVKVREDLEAENAEIIKEEIGEPEKFKPRQSGVESESFVAGLNYAEGLSLRPQIEGKK